ncbi:hypothetical protein [Streptomyces sp. JJ36]|uniref:hypothetical protein n=1 Tax=Streptomyces sp. JJ36 TaxID=2736645 RepID=UPI001F38045A|nr:hypothetical protein [Streptomyces sp. JJ36]
MGDDDAREGRGTRRKGASLAPAAARGLRRLRDRRRAARPGDTGRPAEPRPGDTGAAEGADGPYGAGRAGPEAPGGRPEQAERLRRRRLRTALGVLADRILLIAPRIPVRDLATLRRQFPGLGPEEIADRLVTGALKGSATVGAGVGGAAMLPVPPAMPAELAAEITGVAAVELKLIAELHEVYGQRPPGNLHQRTTAYLRAWTSERRIDVARPATVDAALGGQLRRELRQRLLKRTLRNLPNLAPFLIGAAVGAAMNRRETARLADRVREDLRRSAVPWEKLPGDTRGGALPPADGRGGG